MSEASPTGIRPSVALKAAGSTTDSHKYSCAERPSFRVAATLAIACKLGPKPFSPASRLWHFKQYFSKASFPSDRRTLGNFAE